MLRVEVVEEKGFLDAGIKRDFGDIFTTPSGQQFVDLGWCKNIETGEVGERKVGAQKLKVHNPVVALTKG